jgi:hypothetical protein
VEEVQEEAFQDLPDRLNEENSNENEEDEDEFDDSSKNTPGGSWVGKVRNGSIRGSLIVTTARTVSNRSSGSVGSSGAKATISEKKMKVKKPCKVKRLESLESSVFFDATNDPLN